MPPKPLLSGYVLVAVYRNKTQPHSQRVLIPPYLCHIHGPELNEQMLQLKLKGLEGQLHNPKQGKTSKILPTLSEMNPCTQTYVYQHHFTSPQNCITPTTFPLPQPKIVHSSPGSCLFSSVQFSSVAQSCPTLCDPTNRSTPGLPVHHQLPEFTQTHVHRVSDAIQPSHPLLSPSPPAPSPSQHQSLLQ